MRILISRRAEEDLACIYALILQERPASADAFRMAAEESILLIRSHPEIGPHVTFRTRHKGLRFWPIINFRNYLINYAVVKSNIGIERVMDGRREVRRILRSREK